MLSAQILTQHLVLSINNPKSYAVSIPFHYVSVILLDIVVLGNIQVKKVEQLTEEIITLRRKIQDTDKEIYSLKQVNLFSHNHNKISVFVCLYYLYMLVFNAGNTTLF